LDVAFYNRAVSSSTDPQLTSGQPHRLLGLDVGNRRIGMAVSDLLGITAQGIDTLQRRNKRTDFQQLARVIRNYNVSEIVVGLPLRLSGADSAQTEKVQAFADELRAKFQIPVHMWDERLTSVQANRLMREADVSIEKRAASVDRMAAILILQSFMDAHPKSS
jgi:putative Holliday junction resolvase